MADLKKLLVILVIIFGVVLTMALVVNSWVAREVKEVVSLSSAQAPMPMEPLQPTSKPKRVVINPLNDPLAPVVKKASSSPTSRPPQPKQQGKTYEMPLKDAILMQ
jgi:hypothetical protein